ncbi:hypothetical protein P4H65_00325 [Paenibacillus chitinolyticus]|uniref:hypothetical protein n=1 Tax=Paenibacillus chitinolyticus TaxID=79263 RepID=UPI002DB8B09A|nr:hypothetical protein [Paenibacillus chitinolyticus]MEC0244262.1 hypothetical protein [Paenibacillus chitinolyticus]
MVHIADIKSIVIESGLFQTLDEQVESDMPLQLDSFSLIWLIEQLESRYRISIDYRTLDLEHFSTIRRIHQLVLDKLGAGQP